jgi:single-strand DNA-binding protein
MSKTNHVQLIGNIGSDLSVFKTEAGASILNFSLATNHTYTDAQGNKQKSTEWHNVVSFGKTADTIIKYLTKGSKIMVLGHIQTKTYVNKEGVTMYRAEIIMEECLFLDNKAQ